MPEALSVLDSRNSDNFDKVSLATAGKSLHCAHCCTSCKGSKNNSQRLYWFRATRVNKAQYFHTTVCNIDGMSEVCQPPSSIPSSTAPETLNWDEYTTFRHVNGVTVYQQQEPDSKEATYMVSACVHATPEDCLKVGSPWCPPMPRP